MLLLTLHMKGDVDLWMGRVGGPHSGRMIALLMQIIRIAKG